MQTNFDQIIDKLNDGELWDFPGGVFPAQRKELSNQHPIISLPLPEKLFITLKQHIGVAGHVVVEPGEKVLKGQALSKSMNPFAVPIHAPTSGTIINIGLHESAHPSGFSETTVEIEPDNQDKWIELKPLQDYQKHPKMDVLAAICDAGISGMGGAGFPTHIKASPKKNVEFLIINGVECEPYITSDDRLMREHAWQIRQGIDVLTHLLSPKQVIIAIEDNKPEAIQAMQIACHENAKYMVCSIPTKYPAGGEKQLIQVLTNREVPKQGLPHDVGVIMHNVGTCYAIADAIFSGKPLIQRVVTLSGEALNKSANVWALIGTPIEHLLLQTEYQANKQTEPKVIMGGPMMGFTVVSNQVPVVKTTNCILLPADHEITDNNQEQACIRCGACADVCPASLLPQQLFWHSKAKELDKAQDYNLFDCIECGACAYVCPSEIPLVHYYRVAKAEIRVEQEEKQQSDKARERFEARSARLISEQHERDEKHRKAAEARKLAMASKGSDAKDKIAAALARAKARKQQPSAADGDTPETTTESVTKAKATQDEATGTNTASSKNDKVAAAIARAKAKRQQSAATDVVTPETITEPVTNPTVTQDEATGTNTASSKSDKVAAAIARAKAKRAAAIKPPLAEETNTHLPAETTPEVTNELETKKSRAQAEHKNDVVNLQETGKKGVEEADGSAISKRTSESVQKDDEPTTETKKPASRRKPTAAKALVKDQSKTPEEDNKKAKVVSAVARAKAKRAAQLQNAAQDKPPSKPETSTSTLSASETNDEEQKLAAKKHRIAVAVAKAKAKKAAQQQNPEEK
ncbi:MAG: electron transport complex protein RnfC [Paraglaciecola sp.]|jgi:electron transport complex protein RnfC